LRGLYYTFTFFKKEFGYDEKEINDDISPIKEHSR
jgi:hypothetical protein